MTPVTRPAPAGAALILTLLLLTPLAAGEGPKKSSDNMTGSSDVEIERDIRERFARSKISANKFQVKVENGVATITGKTGVVQHKGVATRLAKLGGARSVKNRIEVSEEARKKASANLAEGRRRTQSKRSEPRSQERNANPSTRNLVPAPLPEPQPTGPRRAVVRWPK
jgi:hypothetical protein